MSSGESQEYSVREELERERLAAQIDKDRTRAEQEKEKLRQQKRKPGFVSTAGSMAGKGAVSVVKALILDK